MEKNIFQIWFVINNSEIPDKWKKAQESVISMNPNWNYILVTEDYALDKIKQYFPDFYDTYTSFKYTIQRIDAIRYVLLYVYGGIYLDLDYICNKSFDGIVLDKEVGLIKSNNTPGVFTNSFIASKKGSEFWLKCINQMKRKLPVYLRLTKHFEIMNSTGPFMLNYVANKNKEYVQTLNDIHTPCNVCKIDNCKISKEYFITPIDGSSWHSWDSKLINFVFCNKKIIILTILLLIFYKLKFT